MTKQMFLLRTAMIAVLIAFGVVAAAPAAAQDDGTPTVVAEETNGEVGTDITDQATDVVEDDDDGFNWGLLGLLGLAGLAGLFRRPQPVVHDSAGTGTGTGTTGRTDNTRI